MYFLADITKKVPIYVHFVEKLQTFDLRALGAVFVENLDGGQFILFYDRETTYQQGLRHETCFASKIYIHLLLFSARASSLSPSLFPIPPSVVRPFSPLFSH